MDDALQFFMQLTRLQVVASAAGVDVVPQWAQLAAATLACLALADVLLRLSRLVSNPKPRWFLLHALCNFAITAACIPPAVAFIRSPVRAFTHPIAFHNSAAMIATLHIYHLLAFDCSAADWFHHIAVRIERAPKFARMQADSPVACATHLDSRSSC